MKIINSILEALNNVLNPETNENQYGQGLIFVPVPERSELEKRIHEAGRR